MLPWLIGLCETVCAKLKQLESINRNTAAHTTRDKTVKERAGLCVHSIPTERPKSLPPVVDASVKSEFREKRVKDQTHLGEHTHTQPPTQDID